MAAAPVQTYANRSANRLCNDVHGQEQTFGSPLHVGTEAQGKTVPYSL